MKYYLTGFIFFCFFFIFTASRAETQDTYTKKEKMKQNIEISLMSVRGKYQSSYGATVFVEDEQALRDLIGFRRNFNDRSRRLNKTMTRKSRGK